MRLVVRRRLVSTLAIIAVGWLACACKSNEKPSKKGVALDLDQLRTMPAQRVCLELSRKLTACGPAFAAQVILSLTARGLPPDEAVIVTNMHTSLPGADECRAKENKAMDAVLTCVSNDCAALSACVLGEPRVMVDDTAKAPQCPDGARAYRGSDNAVRWCARKDGTADGLWMATHGDHAGAGTFRAGKRHGRFEMKGPGRTEVYSSGRMVSVDGVQVSAMKSGDIDVDISLARVVRNSTAASSATIRRLLESSAKADLAACADEQRLRDRFPRGTALLVTIVAPSGNVRETMAHSFDPQLSSCLAIKAKAWRFPPEPGAQTEGQVFLVFDVTTLHVPD